MKHLRLLFSTLLLSLAAATASASDEIVADTYTFNGAESIDLGGTTKYANLTTEEGKTWFGVFFNGPDDAFTYGTFNGESCIVVGGFSTVQLGNAIIENDLFTINGVIKKVIVRAAGSFEFTSCTIRTVESKEGNVITLEDREAQFLDGVNNGKINDYTFKFQGNEYKDAKVVISFDGNSPAFIHSITVVHEDGEEGPAMSGVTGNVKWELTDLNETVTVFEYPNDVVKKLYRLTLRGNGATGDSEVNWTKGAWVNSAPWNEAGLIKEVVVEEGVTALGSYLFQYSNYLQTVTLPSTLTTIGYCTFANCESLSSINIPEHLQTIKSYGLAYCPKIMEIQLPASLTTLYNTSFLGNNFQLLNIDQNNPNFYSPWGSRVIMKKGTTEVLWGSSHAVIPTTATSIGDKAFMSSSIEPTIVIPEGVTNIGKEAFNACVKMTEMELPNSVTTLGDEAFRRCDKLEKFTIGSGVTTIGSNMFVTLLYNSVPVSVLADVYCYANPNNLTWTDYANANFFMANKATKFHVPAKMLETWQTKFPNINANYVGDLAPRPFDAVFNGIAYHFEPDTQEAIVISNTETIYTGNIVIPAQVQIDSDTYTVKAIGKEAFYGTFITGIDLPATLTTIGEDAFATCKRLEEIFIPASVTEIYYDAFNYCSGLLKIAVDANNPVYDSRENCNAIVLTAKNEISVGCRNTTFPESITSIGRLAFSGQQAMTVIDLPENITIIGFNSMTGCDNVKTVTLRGQITEIGEYAFNYYEALTDFTIYAVTPPAIKRNVFIDEYYGRQDLSGLTLHVPAGSLDLYRAAEVWKDFETIVPIVTPIGEETSVSLADEAKTGETVTTAAGFIISLGDDDTVDSHDGSVTITSVMTTAEITDLLATTTPETEAFAEKFKGICFLLAAGIGHIDIECETLGDYQLTVKQGDKALANYTKDTKGTISINYDAATDEWTMAFPTVKETTAARMRAPRAPADYNGTLKIYSVTIVPGETAVTGINNINTNAATPTSIRNLSGQKVVTMRKGIYVVNGRKVVVK